MVSLFVNKSDSRTLFHEIPAENSRSLSRRRTGCERFRNRQFQNFAEPEIPLLGAKDCLASAGLETGARMVASGAESGIRTHNPQIISLLLYPLSYVRRWKIDEHRRHTVPQSGRTSEVV
jgi:hypothetical protein